MGPRQKDRSDSTISSNASKTKCRNERLIDYTTVGKVIGQVFVSHPSAISQALVNVVSEKACQLTLIFKNSTSQEEGYGYGSGGLLVKNIDSSGYTAASATKRDVTPQTKTSELPTYTRTPVTAKHNICNDDGEEFVRATIKFPNVSGPIALDFPDGGCKMNKYIQVNEAFKTQDDDYTFGQKIEIGTARNMQYLFQQVPDTFELRKDHKIGIAVYRSYEIDTTDADAIEGTMLPNFFGESKQACIYTGKVTSVSSNGKTFLHSINTFEGCSGGVVFLLDQNQPQGFDESLYGMAVGIHSGGVDESNNIAFKLPGQA